MIKDYLDEEIKNIKKVRKSIDSSNISSFINISLLNENLENKTTPVTYQKKQVSYKKPNNQSSQSSQSNQSNTQDDFKQKMPKQI